jgi:hypothetical protein
VDVLSSLWDANALRESFDSEWDWLARDVGQAVDPADFARAKVQARTALDAGTRLVYLPIFYALAKKE